MTAFHPGDRVRVQCTADDGFPLVRYGYVGTCGGDSDPVVVMLDDEFGGGTTVDPSALAPVSITTVELQLTGADLLHDPALRQGLVNLWSAEAEAAGLEIGALQPMGAGLPGATAGDTGEGYVLAELSAGGQRYVLRATRLPHDADTVQVRAEHPRRGGP